MKTRSRREIMVALGLVLLLGVVLWPSGWLDETADDEPSVTAPQVPPEDAVLAIARLRSELGQALRAGMTAGPAEAVDACRSEAPRIAAAVARPGLALGRTSHRLRNPANAPRAWVVPLLEDYRAAPNEVRAPRSVELDDGRIGYVEPIYMQPLCSSCHGADVSLELSAHIRALYPRDQALGFAAGEFRGLFWAEVDAQTKVN